MMNNAPRKNSQYSGKATVNLYIGVDELRQLRLECQIVVLTASMDRSELLSALRLGASGYVPESMA